MAKLKEFKKEIHSKKSNQPKAKTFEVVRYTTKEQMYKTYHLLKSLNPKLTEEEYHQTIDAITSNYQQFVIERKGRPIAVVGVEDVLLPSVAPHKSCSLSNIACERKYQSNQLVSLLIKEVENYFIDLGYRSIDIRSRKGNAAATATYAKLNYDKDENMAWRKYINKDADLAKSAQQNTIEPSCKTEDVKLTLTKKYGQERKAKVKKFKFTVYTDAKEMAKTLDLFQLNNPEITAQEYNTSLNHAIKTDKNYKQFVLERKGIPAAMLDTRSLLVMAVTPRKSCSVGNVACAPKYQGNNLTSELMERAESNFTHLGYRALDIVSSKNESESVTYEKSGYTNSESFAWRKYVSAETRNPDISQASLASASMRAKL